MQDLHRRRSARAQLARALVGFVGLLLLGLLTFFLVQGAIKMYGKFSQAAAAHEAASARLAELEVEEARAKSGANDLGTSRGLEAEVRERYGLAKEGEREIVVVRQEGEEGGGTLEQNMWQKLWGAFFVW